MKSWSPARALSVAVLSCALASAAAARPELEPAGSSSDSTEVASTMADSAAALPFEWILPEGWRAETIPFPLGFAPDLPYSGIEELRFAPGMFKAGSDDFWSYAFVWWLDGDTHFDAARLSADLEKYYAGLSLAVEGEGFDPAKAAAVASLAPPRGSKLPESRWVGTLSTHEPFTTHTKVELQLEVESTHSERFHRTAVIFLVSPQPPGHAVWKALAELRDAFRAALDAAN